MDDSGTKPIRRVVTGNDARGRSKVMCDGPAPDVHRATPLTNAWTDFWVWNESPAPLSGDTDDGSLPYDFPGPRNGGHLRAVYGRGKPADYDPANDPKLKPSHAPVERPVGRTWDRGGRNLVLDDGEVKWRPGDIVIDVAAYHQWTSPHGDGIVLYDMIAARFTDGTAGLVQGNAPVMRPDPARKLPAGVKPVRRIVCADREVNRSCLISGGPSPDVRLDPARPGFALQRMWVTDATPAKVVAESLQLPNVLEPPGNGSVLNVFTFPPDAEWEGRGATAK
jgi:hypothetical protein